MNQRLAEMQAFFMSDWICAGVLAIISKQNISSTGEK
jgi:hypothetical protein